MSPKKSRSSSTKASKKSAKPKLICQCCQRTPKDVAPFCLKAGGVELNQCLQCNREVCPKCLKGGKCYICRLKSNSNTNSEAALKKLKKESLKEMLKRLGMKSDGLRNVTEEQMIRQIIKRCDLDGNTRASQPSTSSFKQSEYERIRFEFPSEPRPSEVTVEVTHPKDALKDQMPSQKETAGEYPLLANIQNEEEIRQMSIPQLKGFLKYYGKYDASMNEKREFQDVAIQFWRTEMKIPAGGHDGKQQSEAHQQQPEQRKHGEQVIEIHGNHDISGLDETQTVQKKRESFTLPAEGIGGIPVLGETNKKSTAQESTILVPPLETIQNEDEILRWSTKQLKAFLKKYGRHNESWVEKSTIQYEAIKTWKTELRKEQRTNEVKKEEYISNGTQEPPKTTEVKPKISITPLPPLDHDIGDGSVEDLGSSGFHQKPKILATFQKNNADPEVIHKENLDARPKVVLVEVPRDAEHEITTTTDEQRNSQRVQHAILQGQQSLHMEDFQDYDNIEAFMGMQNGGGTSEFYIENQTAANLAEMASESMETSDSFVYIQPSKDTDRQQAHRPEHLPIKTTAYKKVEFNPVTEQICNSEDERYSPRNEYAEEGATAGSSQEACGGASDFEIPLSPDEFFDTLREMEQSMEEEESSDIPDFTRAVRKRLSSDKSVEFPTAGTSWDYHEDANRDGLHTPEEFLGAVHSIQANLRGDRHEDLPSQNKGDVDIGLTAQRLSELVVTEEEVEAAGKSPDFGIHNFKEAEAESGQSANLEDSKRLDIPFIETNNERVTKILKTKQHQQRPESWGVSIDEILAEENIKQMKPQHLKILLQKHGIDPASFNGTPEMIREVTELWLANKQNRISIYEEAISEGDSGDDSGGKISPDTEFEVCSLPPLPSAPLSYPQITHVTMKETRTINQDADIRQTEHLAGDHRETFTVKIHEDHTTKSSAIRRPESLSKEKPEAPEKTEDQKQEVEMRHRTEHLSGDHEKVIVNIDESNADPTGIRRSEYLVKERPKVPRKPPPPPPSTAQRLGRTSIPSAYLSFVMSEEEIENFEEYKLRAILRTAKVSLKDIWKREHLVEEVIKVWRQEQIERGRSLERSASLSSFGLLNRSRKSSVESLQQEIDFDSIQSEKDLENLTSRNLQKYLLKNGVSIQGILLHEHFLREAIKHWRSIGCNVAAAEEKRPSVKEPEVRLEQISSVEQIESLTEENIKAILKENGHPVGPEEKKADLVPRLKLVWRTEDVNREGVEEAAPPQTTAISEICYQEVAYTVGSRGVLLNNGQSSDIEEDSARHNNTWPKEGNQSSALIEIHGPPKPQRISSIKTLEDITSPEIIQKMEIKQIKALLKTHSVSYADCQEKPEIIQRLETLWRDTKMNKTLEIQPDDLCKICMCERIDCVLIECGHMATCTDCGNKITECPICRNYVVKVVRSYKS